MSERHNQRAAEIIRQILYITIATATKDGKPWNSPVYSAFDKELNFYWASDKNSQHSQNIRINPEVFLVIYDSTVPESTGEGVYIQAEAKELNSQDEAMAGLKVLDDRVGKRKDRQFEKFSGEAKLRIYKATPRKIWMNDDEVDDQGQFARDIRVEVPTELVKLLVG
jgi:nitroimidazol reductase NimA-like FMN-containing flavoprotein (pyridoxamine 5'-phosphate oxidase superfamily)